MPEDYAMPPLPYNNDCTLHIIGKHNVVIAILLSNEYLIASAATVAAEKPHGFSSVRIDN